MNSNWVGSRDRAGQVGDEHDGAFEHGDQQQVAIIGGGPLAVVRADLRSKLGDAALDLLFA